MKKIPIYNAVISDSGCGITCVSLVTDPATQVDFVCFKADRERQKFSVSDAKEHIISGVIMVASTPILRRTPDGFEYYLQFSKETLKLMAEKFLADGTFVNVNVQHQDGSEVKNVNLVELYVIDREKGINPNYFSDVPDGSLIGNYKVRNDEVWEMIEKGEVMSFSLEGFFELYEQQQFKKTKTRTNMAKLKEKLKKLLAEFASVTTDKGELYYEGEELVVGTEVYDENDNPVEDGEYAWEERIIVVKDGKVEEIREKETEEETVIENFKKQRFSKIKAIFEESYDERYAKIYQAVSEAGYPDAYILEAGDTYAVIYVYDEEGEREIRFDLTWDEEGNVTVSNPTEVKEEYVPVEGEERKEEFAEEEEVVEETVTETVKEANIEERLAAVEDSIKDIYDRLDEIKTALEEISNTEAAEPIVEEFKKATDAPVSTGDRKLDNLRRIAFAKK